MKTLKLFVRYKKGLAGVAVITVVFVLASIWSGHAIEGRLAGDTENGHPAAGDDGAPPTGSEVLPDGLLASENETEPLKAPEFGTGGMALKVIGSVAFVIGILYVGMHAIRTLSRRGVRGGVRQDAISVLHKRHIAPKKAIYVVKVAGRVMVVGVTDSQINHLADLSPEEFESIKVAEPTKAGEFKRHLLGFALGSRDKA
jgi:flagellar biogenesis protein FliO